MPNETFDLAVNEPPLDRELADELASFWETVFGASYHRFQRVLRGSELGRNHNVVYSGRRQSELVGTAQVTVSCANPSLGGLGEVATATALRGKGIGRRLTAQARDDFLARGGEALFLGTVNPVAAQLYHRLGWRKLASTNVMCLVAGDRSPEEFLVNYFHAGGKVSELNVTPGSAAERIDMIPLIVCPHDSRVLDANLQLCSTRYTVQSSCLGLFARFDALLDQGQGGWFAARTGDGRLIGLATAHREDDAAVKMDGFVHKNFQHAMQDLLAACVRWAAEHGAQQCVAEIATGDGPMLSSFEALGFGHTAVGKDLHVEGARTTMSRLTMDL